MHAETSRMPESPDTAAPGAPFDTADEPDGMTWTVCRRRTMPPRVPTAARDRWFGALTLQPGARNANCEQTGWHSSGDAADDLALIKLDEILSDLAAELPTGIVSRSADPGSFPLPRLRL